MPNFKVVFNATATNRVEFIDASIATDGGLTVVLQGGTRVFAVPTENVVAIEALIPEPAKDAPPTGNV